VNRNLITSLNLALAKQPEYDNKDDDHRYKTTTEFVCDTARDQASE
jgi:hypothetical protein